MSIPIAIQGPREVFLRSSTAPRCVSWSTLGQMSHMRVSRRRENKVHYSTGKGGSLEGPKL